VIWNLLSNAIKFTPRDGSIGVRVADAHDAVEMRVADDGIGIDASALPHLFERFWQDPRSVRRGDVGLGLGLAIARQLVDLHGGTIGAESAGAGRGSTFIVRLPYPSDVDSA
jgi:signal transduction histidine kinase